MIWKMETGESRIDIFAEHLTDNPVDGLLFAECLTLINDDRVKNVLTVEIPDDHKINEPLPWKKILPAIRETLIDRAETRKFTDELLEERRKLDKKPGFFDKWLGVSGVY